jgi:secondary thiamine-phosphate synthase enzyme
MKVDVKTNSKQELIDITDKVQNAVSESKVKEGVCIIQILHTTAALTVNENADPDVKSDIIKALSIFDRDDYEHGEGNSPAHVKSSLVGSSLNVIVKGSQLQLGTWQGITFCEFDGPRSRQVLIETIESKH